MSARILPDEVVRAYSLMKKKAISHQFYSEHYDAFCPIGILCFKLKGRKFTCYSKEDADNTWHEISRILRIEAGYLEMFSIAIDGGKVYETSSHCYQDGLAVKEALDRERLWAA